MSPAPGCSMRRRLGDFGENVATAHLKRQGYTILARNWRCQLGEIDLIAQAQGDLVFVEVRTRRSRTHGSPEESITKTKQQRLIALAYAYLEAHQLDNDATLAWRIDVVAIDIDHTGRIIRLNHIPYAIEAG